MDYWPNIAVKRNLALDSGNNSHEAATTSEFHQWNKLAHELQAMIIDKAASLEDRKVANTTVQSLRLVSKDTKHSVDNASYETREKIEALNRHPNVLERFEAADKDIAAGLLPRAACRVNGVTDQFAIDARIEVSALEALVKDRNALAREVVQRFEVTKAVSVARLYYRAAEYDFDMNQTRAIDALKKQGFPSNVPLPSDELESIMSGVNKLLSAGAQRDIPTGSTASTIIRNNEEPGLYEMAEYSKNGLRTLAAQHDIDNGMAPAQAADRHGVTDNTVREWLGAPRLEPALHERSRSRSMSR